MVVYTGAMAGYAAELAYGNRLVRKLTPSRTASAPAEAAAPVPVAAASSVASTAAAGGDSATGTAVLERPAAASGDSAPGEIRERGDRVGRIAVSLTVLAFVLHVGAVVARGVAAMRWPWGNMYEFNVAGAMAVTGVYLAMLSRKRVRYLGLFVVTPVLLVLGLAVTVFYTEAEQLVPALKSVWLGIHVSAAVISMGLFTLGFTQTILYLIQARRERVPVAERGRSFLDRFPTAAALDRAAYRTHAFVFPLWTFAIVAGAIWAESAWGRYWGWDPKETWAFITWVAYACYLHARATIGWRGKRAAVVALVAYGTILFNYLVVNIWVVGLHSYAGIK
ncbi:MAG: c-type cytochrome biogenesis protein CcsB [Actinomycetes bacterium]